MEDRREFARIGVEVVIQTLAGSDDERWPGETPLLYSSAASAAEMRTSGAQRAALRTEVPCAHRHITHIMWPVGSDRPDKRRDPSDQGPAKKKIQKKNTCGVGFVSAENCRQKIKKHQKKKRYHAAPQSSSSVGFRKTFVPHSQVRNREPNCSGERFRSALSKPEPRFT
jgi:hypothetical protein